MNGNEVYQWRQGVRGRTVEIRTPGSLGIKWLVPIWTLQGHASEEAWLDAHKDCCHEGCCDPCFMWTATPGDVRKYIDAMRGVKCS